MKLNRDFIKDRIYACWIGKNIGGTMGAPFEGTKEMLNITGFTTKKGEPLPNDDLDLQLIWLCAAEERGIRNVTPQLLGEYWINFVTAHYNEYGIGKGNMKAGLMPPFSGEFNNDKWKNSNGGWIRTEIWACFFPGYPELSVRYAYRDACIDHGMGEGTYAAMFIAALESAAFFEKDIRKLIEKGLSFIPKECLVAKSVLKAIELYDGNVEFKDARNSVMEISAHLGFFQAPANIAFIVLGLLYGDGDFKKSMLYAINCGDDTDCTAATIGSIMGIMGGSECIPSDWAEYIGDSIITVAIDRSYNKTPKSCTELSRRVYEMIPSCLKAYGMYTEYTDGETELDTLSKLPRIFDTEIADTGLSFELPDMIYMRGRVEFDKMRVAPNEEITFRVVLQNEMPDPREVKIILLLPEGWSADKTDFSVFLSHQVYNSPKPIDEVLFTVKAGEKVKSINKIYAEFTSPGRLTDTVVPFIIHG